MVARRLAWCPYVYFDGLIFRLLLMGFVVLSSDRRCAVLLFSFLEQFCLAAPCVAPFIFVFFCGQFMLFLFLACCVISNFIAFAEVFSGGVPKFDLVFLAALAGGALRSYHFCGSSSPSSASGPPAACPGGVLRSFLFIGGRVCDAEFSETDDLYLPTGYPRPEPQDDQVFCQSGTFLRLAAFPGGACRSSLAIGNHERDRVYGQFSDLSSARGSLSPSSSPPSSVASFSFSDVAFHIGRDCPSQRVQVIEAWPDPNKNRYRCKDKLNIDPYPYKNRFRMKDKLNSELNTDLHPIKYRYRSKDNVYKYFPANDVCGICGEIINLFAVPACGCAAGIDARSSMGPSPSHWKGHTDHDFLDFFEEPLSGAL